MNGKTIIVGLGLTASVFGGIDASVMNELPLERTEIIAEERVQAKQIENRVETTFTWKDQVGLKVVVDLGEPTFKERVADKRSREVITETVDFMSEDGNANGFKVDILLNEKPTTNIFCYYIEGHESYDFFYQPVLTEEEILEGASRPENIVGSYAVYHKTLRNHLLGQENYGTGKAFHIPRPQVWSLSDEENKQWADLSYSDGNLCVTVSQEFLDKAEYPVRVDPTFGYTSIGGSNYAGSADRLICLRSVTAPADGTITMISAYSRFNLGSSGAKGVMVASTTNAILTNGVSPIKTVSGTGWQDITYSSSPTITAGTSYHICTIRQLYGGTPSVDWGYDSLTGAGWIDTSNSYTTPTNPTDGTVVNNNFSFYATYTAGTTTPVVTTSAASSISSVSATLNGNISDDGGDSILQHGFAWGTNSGLSDGDTATTTLGSGAEGAFNQTISTLSPNTTYYFRAYAVNSAGTSTGSILNFTTPSGPGGKVVLYPGDLASSTPTGCDFVTSSNDTTDTNQYTFSSVSLGTAASDRYIVVVTGGRKAGAGFTLSSVTVAGQTATIVDQVTNTVTNSDSIGIAVVAVPTGTTGNIVVTWSTTILRSFIGVYRLTALNDPLNPLHTNSTANNPTGALNTATGDCAIGAALTAAATTATWSGITEDFDSTVESFVTYTGAHLGISSASTPLTMTATFGSATESVGVFAVWGGVPVAGGNGIKNVITEGKVIIQ